nr:MAG TPA: hypothetical protein [Caudoviricetes sp.]
MRFLTVSRCRALFIHKNSPFFSQTGCAGRANF